MNRKWHTSYLETKCGVAEISEAVWLQHARSLSGGEAPTAPKTMVICMLDCNPREKTCADGLALLDVGAIKKTGSVACSGRLW